MLSCLSFLVSFCRFFQFFLVFFHRIESVVLFLSCVLLSFLYFEQLIMSFQIIRLHSLQVENQKEWKFFVSCASFLSDSVFLDSFLWMKKNFMWVFLKKESIFGGLNTGWNGKIEGNLRKLRNSHKIVIKIDIIESYVTFSNSLSRSALTTIVVLIF